MAGVGPSAAEGHDYLHTQCKLTFPWKGHLCLLTSQGWYLYCGSGASPPRRQNVGMCHLGIKITLDWLCSVDLGEWEQIIMSVLASSHLTCGILPSCPYSQPKIGRALHLSVPRPHWLPTAAWVEEQALAAPKQTSGLRFVVSPDSIETLLHDPR